MCLGEGVVSGSAEGPGEVGTDDGEAMATSVTTVETKGLGYGLKLDNKAEKLRLALINT